MKADSFQPMSEWKLSPDPKTSLNLSCNEHDLKSALSPFLSGSWAVIGLGNPDRADDGAGLLVARIVQARFPERAFLETETTLESVFDLLPEGCDTLLFVDSADFNGHPGEIRFFQSENLSDFQLAVSTHSLPIGFWFGYAASKGLRPLLTGIQPADLTWMGGMSAAVKAASEILGRVIAGYA
jgi:hydrogenase maturation protease